MLADFGMTILVMVSIVGLVIGASLVIDFLIYNWRNL